VTSLFQMAYSVLHDNNIYYIPDRELYIHDESVWIAFRIDVLRPVDEVVDYCWALAERFAETDLGKHLANKLVIGYESGLLSFAEELCDHDKINGPTLAHMLIFSEMGI